MFRDLPFGPDAFDSPTALLNALVGTEVEITGRVGAKGRIFRVENEDVALPNNAGTTQRHRLTMMTDNGLVQAVIEDVSTLRFTDPVAKAQIERALSGLAENRAKDRRQLSIGFLGAGARKVTISYVVAAPVWKTAYRLVLPKDGSKARLQGWAVVENLTGGDWENVELTLVSGNPVALRQPLYTAFFTDRPAGGSGDSGAAGAPHRRRGPKRRSRCGSVSLAARRRAGHDAKICSGAAAADGAGATKGARSGRGTSAPRRSLPTSSARPPPRPKPRKRQPSCSIASPPRFRSPPGTR